MTPAALRSWRRERRLTQTEAAALVGASMRQWQKWERGESPIRQSLEMALGYYTLTGQTRFPPVMPG